MKKLLTTACLFVATAVAIDPFIAPAVFGQEKKTGPVAVTAAKSFATRVGKARILRAKVRELATIEGDVNGFVGLPGGHGVIYSVDSSTFTYDAVKKQSTLLGTNMYPASVSPNGDFFAFSRSSDDPKGVFLWTMPIDPKTGIATGQAQRMSGRLGRKAKFSPDGKTLAFISPRPDGTRDIVLAPATGGAESVVAHYPAERDASTVGWSADGQFLYVELGGQTVIERVPVAGGPSQPLIPRTGITDCFAMGFTPRASIAFYQCNPDRFFYRTSSGVEGEISVALPTLDSGWGNDLSLESAKYIALTKVWNQSVRVLDLTNGQSRDILPSKVPSSSPAWSPSGKRLAVLTGTKSHYDVVVMDTDGSSPRRYPMPIHLNGWSAPPWEMPWSPDGRYLAFRAHERPTVGWSHDQSQLALLDVESGQTRFLTKSNPAIGGFMWQSEGRTIRHFVWRPDGQAIRALKLTLVPMGAYSPSRWTIVEIGLDGTEQTLRDISLEFPTAIRVVLASANEAVVTATVGKKNERFLVPLDGGASRSLPNPVFEPDSRMGGTVIDTLTDGKQIVGVGKITGDSAQKLSLMPLDGSAPRLIGEIPRGTSFAASGGAPTTLSPDRKRLAYTSDGRYISKFTEIDFAPVVKAIKKR